MQNKLELSPGQIRTVFDVLGITPAPQSPLLAASKVGPEEDESVLGNMGALSPAWRQALLDLADPALEFRLIEAAPEASFLQLYYRGNRQGAPLIRVQPAKGNVHLTLGYEPKTVAAELGNVLWEHRPPYAVDYEAELSPAGVSAWAASMDSIRALLFASLLKRLPQMNLLLDLDELNHHVSEGFAFDDARWLVTLLRSLGPQGGIANEGIEHGVTELEKLSLLVPGPDGWQPSGAMKYMAATLKTPMPAAATVLTFYGNKKVYPYIKYSVAMCGDGPLWTMDYSGLEAGQPMAHLSSCDGDTLLATWTRYLTEVPERETIVPEPKPAPKPKPTESLDSMCSNCGKSLRPGAAFCAFCGSPAGRVKPKPSPPECVSCKSVLKPGAAFCSQCGTKQ